jgi:hypothetical protein
MRRVKTMYVYEQNISELTDWIQKEISVDGHVSVGHRGISVRRVQEWLSLQGYALAIDGIFGPITADVVARYQEDAFLSETGRVDSETFAKLTTPMRETLRQRLTSSESINAAVLEYAHAHLDQHPREIGGQNRGPWVRMYLKGNDGTQWAWCAGFVTFILHQASESLKIDMPIRGSFSCDTLVAQAREAGRFLSESEARNRHVELIPPGSLFVVRRTDTDWTHVGIITEVQELLMRTIEGNTNDDGEREGYEVCARSRGYANKDFILISR